MPLLQPASEDLRRLLHEHGKALRRLAEAWTRTDADRDDLVQDIAVALLEALPRFRGECPERAFVWRIAQNRCLLAARRRRPVAGLPEHLPAKDLPAIAVVQRRERAGALLDAIRCLPEDQRIVVLLVLEGLSHQEIGDVVGATANADGVRVHRAREALIARLATTPERRSA
jgi:RNA polymerase sigma-70 factor (ECF subfamily)